MTKAQEKRDGLAAWWSRPPWPVVILAADPGRRAGAAILSCDRGGVELVKAVPVDTYTREVDVLVKLALAKAEQRGVPFFLALEAWGRGGPMGIDQWLGLGEQRGAWRRTFIIEAPEHQRNVVQVTQSRWRSRMVEETGDMTTGQWQPFGPDGWKQAALRAARAHLIDGYVPDDPDAAEATCIALFAARSDEVGNKLSKRYLAGAGYDPVVELENLISGKEKRKRGRTAKLQNT